MKRRLVCLLLALLCAVLAGCGGDAAPDEPEDLPGSDWRTWGLVNDYGTIIRDGEETSVLVCLDESGATFYYDDATQTVYDSVAFPAEIPDVWYLYTSISFDDRNGDGQSDVCMDFHENEDSEAVYIWYWDAEQGYVFQPDISTVSRYAADGSSEDSDLLQPIYTRGEYQWIFHVNITNDTSETLHLEKLQIFMKNAGTTINGGEYVFEGQRLADIGLGNVTLSPNQNIPWNDGHPLVDFFDEMVYTCTFSTPTGQKVVREYSFKLSHDKPEIVYPNYAADTGRDLVTLRYEADYCVNVAPGVYWVPASSLGSSSYNNAEIQAMLTDTPEQKQAKIDTLYEALQLYQIGNFSASDDNIRITEGSIHWEHHKPGYDAVRTNTGCCATDSNWLRYILDGDYDEIGYMATSQRDGSGHIYNYIKLDGWYYFIDLTHYRTDWVDTAPETGNLEDYQRSDRVLGNIHKVRDVMDYVNYVQDAFSDPPGLMFFYTAENCLALDGVGSSSGITITYETVHGVDVQVVFDDPGDRLYYTFTSSPWKRADFSVADSFDFSKMKFSAVR